MSLIQNALSTYAEEDLGEGCRECAPHSEMTCNF